VKLFDKKDPLEAQQIQISNITNIKYLSNMVVPLSSRAEISVTERILEDYSLQPD
jgi:hypothetical protein